MFTLRHFSLIIYALALVSCLFSCKKPEDKEPVNVWQLDSIYDIDSNAYTIVKIGEKWWMAEDLRTTRFRDSTQIPQIQLQNSWLKAASAYCIFQNNPQSLSLLYNFSAVADSRGIAPLGWHIATDEEWKELEKLAGMNSAEADALGWRGENKVAIKLKIQDRKGWLVSENTWPQNNTGVSLSGIGGRLHDGAWAEPGLFSQGFWWTSNRNGERAIYRQLDYKYNEVFRNTAPPHYGMAVRCVKD